MSKANDFSKKQAEKEKILAINKCERVRFNQPILTKQPRNDGNIIACTFIKKLMENLFSTNLSIDNKNVSYHVFFDQEKYTFEPEVKEEPFPSFSFKREHDEWHEQSNLSTALKNQAINALEKYLLAQH